MPVLVALLRAVNVGGKSIVMMDQLSTLCVALGHRNVETYLQSGNVVFRAQKQSLAQIASGLEGAIADSLGVETNVILRSPTQMRAVVANNPFSVHENEPNKLLVAYFQSEVPVEIRKRAAGFKLGTDELHFAAREAYIYYPNGAGKATLTWGQLERAARIPATARNWNTTLQLLQRVEALERASTEL